MKLEAWIRDAQRFRVLRKRNGLRAVIPEAVHLRLAAELEASRLRRSLSKQKPLG